MNLGLADQAALVMGGSRGIGRATALGLAAEGARVAIAARDAAALEAAADGAGSRTCRSAAPPHRKKSRT